MIQFDDYKRCLDKNSVASRVQRTIVSRAHRVYTIQQCKLALSPFDDKRYFVPPSKVETLPWRHYRNTDPQTQKMKLILSTLMATLSMILL